MNYIQGLEPYVHDRPNTNSMTGQCELIPVAYVCLCVSLSISVLWFRSRLSGPRTVTAAVGCPSRSADQGFAGERSARVSRS